jgi:hypothetical protein
VSGGSGRTKLSAVRFATRFRRGFPTSCFDERHLERRRGVLSPLALYSGVVSPFKWRHIAYLWLNDIQTTSVDTIYQRTALLSNRKKCQLVRPLMFNWIYVSVSYKCMFTHVSWPCFKNSLWRYSSDTVYTGYIPHWAVTSKILLFGGYFCVRIIRRLFYRENRIHGFSPVLICATVSRWNKEIFCAFNVRKIMWNVSASLSRWVHGGLQLTSKYRRYRYALKVCVTLWRYDLNIYLKLI